LADAPDDGSSILVRATLGTALARAASDRNAEGAGRAPPAGEEQPGPGEPDPGADHYNAAIADLERRGRAIVDARTRRSFLTDVPLHRWLRARRFGTP
jgi:hypothetical protein